MAKSSLIYALTLAFLPILAISSSHHHHKIKSKKFTLYQHDIFNTTDFVVVQGVAGASLSQIAAPLGTITVLKDNLTLTPDPSSKVVGSTEGLIVASSLDGLDGLSVFSVALNLENGRLNGTISLVGVVNSLKPTNDIPVTGGTGDFLLVQGYITTTLVSLSINPFTVVVKMDFHLYWPPYAPHAMKGF